MHFSTTATTYLSKLRRDKGYDALDRSQIVGYLLGQGIPAFEKVIDFQLTYSGLSLTIFKRFSHTFDAHLFSVPDIQSNAPIEYLLLNGKYYFYCGDHRTAQFWFVLGQDGQLCTYDNNEETVNVIFSGFDKFVETYAMKDFLSINEKYAHPLVYDLIDPEGFLNLTRNYFRHNLASDAYNEWLSKDDLVINKGTWFDKGGFSIKFYADNSLSCEAFIDVLKSKKIIG